MLAAWLPLDHIIVCSGLGAEATAGTIASPTAGLPAARLGARGALQILQENGIRSETP